MAAPSVGRRSCVGQRNAAALIYQSRRWIYGRVKVLLYDGFFSLPSSGRNNQYRSGTFFLKINKAATRVTIATKRICSMDS